MKKYFQTIMFSMAIAVLATGFTSCSSDDDDDKKDDATNNDEVYTEILKSYVNTTVVPTYKALAEAALEMRAANEALKENPSDANMQAASAAWMKARIEWEMSEAFLIGPVSEDFMSIDPHIDSWPLELEAIKAEIAKEDGKLTGARAWKELEAEVIGFHVTEYLLYRDGQSRPVADLTAGELNYLTAATDALVWDCMLVYVAWAGIDNVSADIKAVYQENPDVVSFLETGNTGAMNYGSKMIAGEIYGGTLESAVEEIIMGITDISDEVGATKIEAPYTNGRTEDVESWYSWHSLDDYQNNILSIKNAYMGGRDDNSRTAVSLSTFVKENNAALDTEIKEKIEDAIAKIKAIGDGGLSFYEVVKAKKAGDTSKKEAVDAAVNACLALKVPFEKVKSDLLK